MTSIIKQLLFLLLHISLLLLLSGCQTGNGENQTSAASPLPAEAATETATPQPPLTDAAAMQPSCANTAVSESIEGEQLVSLYQEIYEETAPAEASDGQGVDNLSLVQKIAEKLDSHGVTAIDDENQIDMTNPQQLHTFIAALENGETAALSVVIVSAYGRFTVYELCAEEYALAVVKTYYQYTDGNFENKSRVSYPADSWQYTDEGYFMFTGKSSSAESLVLTMSDDDEIVAWRVEPLDARYREWNRRYLLPVGYGRNNLFLVDWSENTYNNLDFYDLFDKFYPQAFGQPVPYTASKEAAVGAVYHIPEKEFERAISLHLAIDSEALRSKTKYLKETKAYEYHPRGFYEAEYSNLPYPEVVGGTEHSDGTLTLLVNAVYPAMETSCAFTHELTVRTDAQGFVYVSNKLLPNAPDCDMGWHTDRLTDEEWEAVYGETALLTETEQSKLEQDALAAARQLASVFQKTDNNEISETPRLISEQCREAVLLLGKAGFVSVAEDVPMENPERLEAFFADYRERLDGQVTVFQVNADKTLDAITFFHRSGKLQTCYIGIGFHADGTPEKREARLRDVASIELTPKGYFIYAYKETPQYAALCQYWRIRPLSDKCRELTEAYIRGLSYVNYNMLVTDWDADSAERILTPALYEDLCRIHAGREPDANNGQIPASQYEEIMTRCLPVTRKQVQELCGYDPKTDSYPYEVVMHRQYPPFGEVTDYTENADGTITLTVDGVWIEKGTDCAFKNTIVVQPFADGGFRYLSNSIEEKEAAIPYAGP